MSGNKGSGTASAPAKAKVKIEKQPEFDNQGLGNVDKIRDILFGSQMRDYERQFDRIEEAVRKESAELRSEMKKRLDTLEAHINHELESLRERVKTERGERTEAVEEINRAAKKLGDSLSKKISDLDEKRSENERKVRQDLLQQSTDLQDTIQKRHDEIVAALERRSEELRTGKVDRAALAEMLTEVAMRLSDEFRIPSTEG